jgi:hypothetical protein
MNPNTWISFLTTTIGAAATASATDGLITGNAAQTIISVAGIAVPYLWGLFIHRDSKVVQTASQVAGVQPIKITTDASPALQSMAKDDSIKTVIEAAPQPSPYATSIQRQ